jgi:KipI family sensor histidine kinase inhibitor
VNDVSFAPSGLDAVLMIAAKTPSEPLLNRLYAMQQLVQQASPPWLVDIVPAYVTLLVRFDPSQISRFAVQRWLRDCWSSSQLQTVEKPTTHTIPVYYSLKHCPDLDVVAAMKGMSIDEVITLHSSLVYRVYALGFAPGFAYLGSLDPQLTVPRLAVPRQRIPAGSVAIAESQTAIYPAASPAGWHVLGLCPLDLMPRAECLQPHFKVGDEVRFEPIDEATFLSLGGKCEEVV